MKALKVKVMAEPAETVHEHAWSGEYVPGPSDIEPDGAVRTAEPLHDCKPGDTGGSAAGGGDVAAIVGKTDAGKLLLGPAKDM